MRVLGSDSALDKSLDRVPDKVKKAAHEQGLGRLLHVRRFTHPLLWAGSYLGGALVAAAAGLMLEQVANGWEGDLTRRMEVAVGLAEAGLVVFGAFLVLAAVIALARGRRVYYLWEGGFIQHNGLVMTYPWAEVEALLLVRHHTGGLTGEVERYRLVPRRGRPITIPVERARDPFSEALVKAMLGAGRPVA